MKIFSRLDIFPLDHSSALLAGEILGKSTREGKTIDALDTMIAAIAISHGCNVIVTRNISHFDRIKGIDVESY